MTTSPEASMLLITSSWADKPTFKLMPIAESSLFVEGIYDTDSKVLVLITKIKKDSFGLNKPCQDLYVITGHSLLFKEIPDNIKNEYYDETIYNTTVYDDYKKIIVLHTNIYETPTLEELNVINYKIKYFHIALENENKDEHYAIYYNNILTETMTLNYANKSNLIPLLKN